MLVVFSPAELPKGARIHVARGQGGRVRALLGHVRPDLSFAEDEEDAYLLLSDSSWPTALDEARARGVREDRLLVMPAIEAGWPDAEWCYSYWAVPLSLMPRRPDGQLRLDYQQFRRLLMERRILHGEFHGQHLCDGYRTGSPTRAGAISRVLNLLSDEESRVELLTVMFGEPLHVWRSWCKSLLNHLEYMDYAVISPGDVVLNCGIMGGSEVPYFLAALDGRGLLVNIDPFGYDCTSLYTQDVLRQCGGLAVEVRTAVLDRDGEVELPIRHGMAVSGAVEPWLGPLPRRRFPCRRIDSLVRDLALPRVDLIKMDIEGGEPAALDAAAETIRAFRPQLAISIYHEADHFWQIPLQLSELCEGYRFYVKHYHYHCAETLLYAIPAERGVKPRRDAIWLPLE